MAGLGDDDGFRAAVDRTERRRSRTCLHERRHGMDFADGLLDLAYYEGLGHLALNYPVEARTSFERALSNLPPIRVKARSRLTMTVDVQLDAILALDGAVRSSANLLVGMRVAGDAPGACASLHHLDREPHASRFPRLRASLFQLTGSDDDPVEQQLAFPVGLLLDGLAVRMAGAE